MSRSFLFPLRESAVAKKEKKKAKQPSDPPETNAPETDGPEQDAEGSPKVQKAAEAVEKAQQHYQKVRQEATDRLKAVREKSVGDLIDGTLGLVKKYPGPGVIVAALIGFFLGRLFRR